MEHQNVTLSLPKPLLQKFRVLAATRNQSMTRLMADAIQKMVEDADRRATRDWERQYERNKRSFMARIQNPRNLGTGGKIPWTRDDLHER